MSEPHCPNRLRRSNCGTNSKRWSSRNCSAPAAPRRRSSSRPALGTSSACWLPASGPRPVQRPPGCRRATAARRRRRRDADGEILDGDELALGGRDTTQDGTTDQAPAQDKALIPSSFGMTFSLNLEATECNCRRPGASTSKRSANTSSARRPATPGGSGSGIPVAASIA